MDTAFTWIAALLISAVVGCLFARGLGSARPIVVVTGGVVGGLVGAVVLRLLFAGPLAGEYTLLGCIFGALLGVWALWSLAGGSAPAVSGHGGAAPRG